jgi:hypothetical protein
MLKNKSKHKQKTLTHNSKELNQKKNFITQKQNSNNAPNLTEKQESEKPKDSP